MAYGDNMGNPGEAGGSVGDWGGGEGDVSDWTTVARAMREAMYGPRALRGHSPANVGYGPPQGWGAYAQVGPQGWGNVDAMTGVYGQGSPLDPMSGAATLHGTGTGQRQGPAWGPGIGYGPYNAPRGPVTGIFGPPGTRFGPEPDFSPEDGFQGGM